MHPLPALADALAHGAGDHGRNVRVDLATRNGDGGTSLGPFSRVSSVTRPRRHGYPSLRLLVPRNSESQGPAQRRSTSVSPPVTVAALMCRCLPPSRDGGFSRDRRRLCRQWRRANHQARDSRRREPETYDSDAIKGRRPQCATRHAQHATSPHCKGATASDPLSPRHIASAQQTLRRMS